MDLIGTFTFPSGHPYEALDGETVDFVRSSPIPPDLTLTYVPVECAVWRGIVNTCYDCFAELIIYCARIAPDPEFPDVTELRYVVEFDCDSRCESDDFSSDADYLTENFDCKEPLTSSAAGLTVTGGDGRRFFWADWVLSDLDIGLCLCSGGCCDDPEIPDTVEIRWYLPGCALDGTGTTLTKHCCEVVANFACGFVLGDPTPIDIDPCLIGLDTCYWYGTQDIDSLCADDAKGLRYYFWCDEGTIYLYVECHSVSNPVDCTTYLSRNRFETTDFTCDPFAFFIAAGSEGFGPGCCGEDCGGDGGICVTPGGSPCDPGIDTDCCADTIPSTLSALVETDCPALTGFTVTLNHLSGQEWEGTTSGLCDGAAYSFRLRISCTGSWAGEADLAADLGSAFSCFSDLLLSQTSETCDPLEVVLEADVTIDPFNPDCSCCGGVISTITVTITE